MAYLFSRIEGRSLMDVSLGEFRVSAGRLMLVGRQVQVCFSLSDVVRC